MGLFERWMFCFVIVAAHWVNAGPVAYIDAQRPCGPRPGEMLSLEPLDQVRRPAIKLKPALANPGQGFAPAKLQKPPLHQVFPPFYPKYKPSRVPTNTKTQSGLSEDSPQTKPPQRPSWSPGQKPPYWVKVPSPWYLNKRHPFRYVPGSSFKKPAKQLSKPNVLTEKTTVTPRQEFPKVSTPRPQTANVRFVQLVHPPPSKKEGKDCTTKAPPKYEGVKVIKLQAEKDNMLDSPDSPPVAQNNLKPFLPRYHMQQWPPTEEPNHLKKVYPVLQKKQIPRFEWSGEKRQWIPRFPDEDK